MDNKTEKLTITFAIETKVTTKEAVVKEVVEQCIRLVCHCCNKGIELYEGKGLNGEVLERFLKDHNLYHVNGSPCRAYLIRRDYKDLRNFENKVSV